MIFLPCDHKKNTYIAYSYIKKELYKKKEIYE